jgi:periplasmic mercuric ion binding protein
MKTIKIITGIALILAFAAGSLHAQQPKGREEVKIQTNLDCPVCKKKIEDYMAFERGVTAVSADVATKIVTIEYRANRTDKDKLVAALIKLGYEAEMIEKDDK